MTDSRKGFTSIGAGILTLSLIGSLGVSQSLAWADSNTTPSSSNPQISFAASAAQSSNKTISEVVADYNEAKMVFEEAQDKLAATEKAYRAAADHASSLGTLWDAKQAFDKKSAARQYLNMKQLQMDRTVTEREKDAATLPRKQERVEEAKTALANARANVRAEIDTRLAEYKAICDGAEAEKKQCELAIEEEQNKENPDENRISDLQLKRDNADNTYKENLRLYNETKAEIDNIDSDETVQRAIQELVWAKSSLANVTDMLERRDARIAKLQLVLDEAQANFDKVSKATDPIIEAYDNRTATLAEFNTAKSEYDIAEEKFENAAEVLEEVAYDGDELTSLDIPDQAYDQGNNQDLSLVFDYDFATFEDAVYVDGIRIDKDCYKVTTGSTHITLSSSFLDTLSPGAHTITADFAGERRGSAKVLINEPEKPVVDDKDKEDSSDNTGIPEITDEINNNIVSDKNENGKAVEQSQNSKTFIPSTGDTMSFFGGFFALIGALGAGFFARRKFN